MGLLNVAVTTATLGQTRVEPAGGVTAVTVGGASGVVVPAVACLSGSPHPAKRTASRNAGIQILLTFNLRIGFSSTSAQLQGVPASLNRRRVPSETLRVCSIMDTCERELPRFFRRLTYAKLMVLAAMPVSYTGGVQQFYSRLLTEHEAQRPALTYLALDK
jgi:hypothetical protein